MVTWKSVFCDSVLEDFTILKHTLYSENLTIGLDLSNAVTNG